LVKDEDSDFKQIPTTFSLGGRINHQVTSDHILAEPIQAGGETLCSENHKHINSIWNKEELPEQWKNFIIVPVYKKGDNTELLLWYITVINFMQKFVQCPSLKVNSMCRQDYWRSSVWVST
jgi:hypothetical protein